MECGLTPDEFWNATWYELDLLNRQQVRKEEKQWEHTRLIISALIGEKPTKIIKLSTDTLTPHSTTTKTDAQRILAKHEALSQRLKP